MNLDVVLWQNYVADVAAYFVMAGVAGLIFAKRDFDLLDPIVLFSALYVSLFALAPIHDIIADDYLTFGINTFVYGVEGTFIAVVGYVGFGVGYLLRLPVSSEGDVSQAPVRSAIAGRALFMWAVAFLVALLSAMASGKGATYILSLGLIGDAQAQPRMDAPLGFGIQVALALIPTAIIYAHVSKTRVLSGVIQVLTFTLLASQGFRYTIIIFVLAHVYVWYMKRNSRPRLATIVALVAGLALYSGAMGLYRGALRSGDSMDWGSFGVASVETAVFENLAIYKTYYGVVHAVPDLVPYGLGSQMFIYTAVMFVPRILWPGKPLPDTWDPIRAGISDYAAEAGSAYPNIGEYYYEFGLFGVVTFMCLLGLALNLVRSRYRTSSDVTEMVLYAVVVAAMFQLIIRGYTPSNFYMVVLLVAPPLLIGRSGKLRSDPMSRRSLRRSVHASR